MADPRSRLSNAGAAQVHHDTRNGRLSADLAITFKGTVPKGYHLCLF